MVPSPKSVLVLDTKDFHITLDEGELHEAAQVPPRTQQKTRSPSWSERDCGWSGQLRATLGPNLRG